MLVEAHQGKLEVISKDGNGSTFRFSLPLGPRGKNGLS
jgi:signal transduction histidine kinase